MKQLIQFVLLVLAISLSITLQAQNQYQVKSHNLVVKGTSNLHDWTAEVEDLKGDFKIIVENNKIVSIDNLQVRVNAKSLKGSKGSIMDSKISDALNTKKHPEIQFKLQKINSITEGSGVFNLSTSGILKISGVSKPVNLNAMGKVLPSGEIEFIGSTNLKMSDFSIEPPKAMFGALTTGDEVTLNYTVVLKPNMLTNR